MSGPSRRTAGRTWSRTTVPAAGNRNAGDGVAGKAIAEPVTPSGCQLGMFGEGVGSGRGALQIPAHPHGLFRVMARPVGGTGQSMGLGEDGQGPYLAEAVRGAPGVGQPAQRDRDGLVDVAEVDVDVGEHLVGVAPPE